MQDASATRTVHATTAQLWPLIADVRAIEHWNPNVDTVDLLSEQPTGLGAARRCNFYDGTNVREEVVELEEEGRVRLELSEFSLPMKQLYAEISIAPKADGGAEITFALDYEVKFGPLGKLMGATVIRGQMKKMAARILAALDHHVATGETIGKDFVAQAA